MPTPDRPVSHASIESAWGQAVHDATFAPKGVRAHGASGIATTTAWAALIMDTADEDPGGWLSVADNWLEVPTGADGLYDGVLNFRATGATDGQVVLAAYGINGTAVASVMMYGETGVAIQASIPLHEILSAGDIINAQARESAGGIAATVQLWSISLIRRGDEYGS